MRTASAPFAASPITAIPGSHSSSMRKASRCNCWSSATSTLIISRTPPGAAAILLSAGADRELPGELRDGGQRPEHVVEVGAAERAPQPLEHRAA